MSDQLEELEGLLADLPEAVERRRLGDRLNQSMTVLRTAEHNISRIEAVVDLADLTGMAAAGQGQAIQRLKEEALEVGEWLETASTDDELRDAVFEYEKVLLRTLANSELTVRNYWKVTASQRFRPLMAFGELLQRINVEPELGAKLVETGRRALAAEQISSAKGLCDEVRQLLAAQESLQKERTERISEGEIGSFISALADHKATLEMVTPGVRTWLEDSGALDRFNVVPRPQGIAGAVGG